MPWGNAGAIPAIIVVGITFKKSKDWEKKFISAGLVSWNTTMIL